MNGSRGATTIVEMMVVFAIAVVVLGGALAAFRSLNVMARSTDLSAALQDAGLALALIERDLQRAIPRPDGSLPAVKVSAAGLQLVRGVPGPGGRVDGTLVVYEKQGSAATGYRIRRTAGSEGSFLPGLYRGLQVAMLSGPGGPFVRVTLLATARPGAPATGPASAEAVSSSLVRVPGLDARGAATYDWSFLDGVKAVSFR